MLLFWLCLFTHCELFATCSDPFNHCEWFLSRFGVLVSSPLGPLSEIKFLTWPDLTWLDLIASVMNEEDEINRSVFSGTKVRDFGRLERKKKENKKIKKLRVWRHGRSESNLRFPVVSCQFSFLPLNSEVQPQPEKILRARLFSYTYNYMNKSVIADKRWYFLYSAVSQVVFTGE